MVEQNDLHTFQCCSNPNTRNVGRKEQIGSILAGGGLIAYGLMSKSKLRLINLISGASLIYRGMSGHCKLYQRLGINTAQVERRPGVNNSRGRKITSSVHINRDRRDLYDLWRNLSNLPNVCAASLEIGNLPMVSYFHLRRFHNDTKTTLFLGC